MYLYTHAHACPLQVSLADIPMPQAGAEVPAVVTGSHSAATYLMLLDMAAGWQQAVQALVTGEQEEPWQCCAGSNFS